MKRPRRFKVSSPRSTLEISSRPNCRMSAGMTRRTCVALHQVQRSPSGRDRSQESHTSLVSSWRSCAQRTHSRLNPFHSMTFLARRWTIRHAPHGPHCDTFCPTVPLPPPLPPTPAAFAFAAPIRSPVANGGGLAAEEASVSSPVMAWPTPSRGHVLPA